MTARLLLFLLLAILLFGCSTVQHTTLVPTAPPVSLLSTSPYEHLKARIDSLISDSLFPPSNLGIEIFSLTRGEILYELNSQLLFTPASNQKLLTSAAALGLLGAGYEFTTEVFVDSAEGPTITIRGSGDPLVKTEDLDSIAYSLHQIIDTTLSWTLLGDLTLFDQEYWGKGWMWDDEPGEDEMFITPLSVNGNTLLVRVTPGAMPGEPVRVETIPVTSYVTIENNARTVEQRTDDSITISRAWRSRSNTIQVEGTFAAGKSPRESTLSLWQPEDYFLTLLAEKLEHYGVRASLSGFDTVRSGRQPVVTITHRLDSVVTYMNKQSDNLSAENLFKTLGANFLDPPGSAAKGTQVIKSFLSVCAVDTSRVVVADGSGVSRYDLISADGLIKVLTRMAGDSQAFPAFNASLPVAGVDGTLSKRMKNSPAAGNLRGKTGSLTGVSSLSGYARTAEGELLAFSILMQNFVTGPSRYRGVQDRIGALMCSLRRETF